MWIEKYREAGSKRNRVAIDVNGDTISLLMTGQETDYGSVFSGAIKYLRRGSYIGLKAVFPSKLWIAQAHTFFGAYKI